MAGHRKGQPAGPPKPATDIEGVSREWDNDTELRDYIREGGKVLDAGGSLDISTSVKHYQLLSPLLSRMALVETRTVPSIDQLKDEVSNWLVMGKKGVEIDFQDVSKKAWQLRKLCGFVKTKARRHEVSTATRLHQYPCTC